AAEWRLFQPPLCPCLRVQQRTPGTPEHSENDAVFKGGDVRIGNPQLILELLEALLHPREALLQLIQLVRHDLMLWDPNGSLSAGVSRKHRTNRSAGHDFAVI